MFRNPARALGIDRSYPGGTMNPVHKGLVVASLTALTLVSPRMLEDVPRVLTPLPEVGVQFHAGWTTYTDEDRIAVLDRLAAAGVDWVRIDVGWCSIEPSRAGERAGWYVENLDMAVDAARERGMEVLMTLWCTPSWASSAEGSEYVTRAAPPEDDDDFRRIAAWAAAHWEGRVSAWEIWNEPDLPAFFGGNVGRYVRLLKAGHAGIKAGDPSAQVVLGAPVPNDVDWLKALYERGAAPYFDVMATHPYSVPLNKPPEMDDGTFAGLPSVDAVKRLMRKYGDGDKPIWFTEFGWSTHENDGDESKWQKGVTEEQQADYIARAVRYIACKRPYVEKAFIYVERDRPLPRDPDPHTEHVSRFGLLDENLEPKPAYFSLASVLTNPHDLCLENA
jgi:polysaccharide biosynthesis protein PslG